MTTITKATYDSLTTDELFFLNNIDLTCDNVINSTPEDKWMDYPEDSYEEDIFESLAAKGVLVIDEYLNDGRALAHLC